MAKMFPKVLSAHVLNDRMLRGERDVYAALSQLPDEFEVFYNRSVECGKGVRAYRRKADFIIIHKQLGLLAVEVKGGKIRIGDDGGFEQYHPRDKSWAPIDPIEQAQKAMRELIFMAKSDGANYFIPDNCCAIFPHIQRHQLTTTPHLLPSGILFNEDVPILKQQLPPLFSGTAKNPAWKMDQAIDMRRRLQALPEAQGSHHSVATSPKKTGTALRKTPATAKAVPQSASKKQESYHAFSRLIDSVRMPPLPRYATAKNETVSMPEECSETPPFYDDDPIVDDFIDDKPEVFQGTPRYYVKERPYAFLDEGREKKSYKKKLRKREIFLALVIGLLAFCAVSWFFPNSFLRQLTGITEAKGAQLRQ